MLHHQIIVSFANIKFNAENLISNERPVVISKINNNSSKNYKKYRHKYNIYFARDAFVITIFIF